MEPEVRSEADLAPLPVWTGVMYVLDETGEHEVKWNSRNPDEVSAARAGYEAMRGKRYVAYKVSPSGEREVIHKFDPNAEHILFAPPLVGG